MATAENGIIYLHDDQLPQIFYYFGEASSTQDYRMAMDVGLE